MKTKPFLAGTTRPKRSAGRLTAHARTLLPLLLLCTLPAAVRAQFNYEVNNGTIAITGYTGPGGAVEIPDTINGLPVTKISERAFWGCTGLTSIVIPDSVTSIGGQAFIHCTSLTGITIPTSATSIGDAAFEGCTSLTSIRIPNSVIYIGNVAFRGCTKLASVTIPDSVSSLWGFTFHGCTGLTNVVIGNSVTSIGDFPFYHGEVFRDCTALTSVIIGNSVARIGVGAFSGCASLTSITLPNSVTNIHSSAFSECAHLTSVYFEGNAPSLGQDVFSGADNVTVYYQPGTTGWGATFGGRPTAVWKPQVQTGAASFGVRANEFGFTVAWARDRVVVVEACTDLAQPIWSPVSTNILTGGTAYFSDADWVRHPDRFYRVRSP